MTGERDFDDDDIVVQQQDQIVVFRNVDGGVSIVAINLHDDEVVVAFPAASAKAMCAAIMKAAKRA
jgi:hypothetical protein